MRPHEGGLEGNGGGRALAAILGVALALRVAFIFYLDPSRIYFSDTIAYVNAAESLLAGNGFGPTYARQPLYPMFLAGVLALFPGELLAVKLVDALLACVTVYLTYLVGDRIWGRRVGLLGAALVAVHPYLVVLSAFAYAEILFTLLLLGSTLLLLGVRGVRTAAAAGVLAGAAALAKSSGLVMLVAGAAWLLLAARQSTAIPLGAERATALRGLASRAAMTAAFVLAAALTVSPWIVRNYRLYGDVSLVEARRELHLTSGGDGRSFEMQVERRRFGPADGQPRRSVRRTTLEHVAEQLARFWALTPEDLKTSRREVREKAAEKDPRMVVERHPVERTGRWATTLAAVLLPYYLFALAGLWAARGRPRESSLLLLIVAGFSLGRAIFHARLRYRLPIEPEVALFAAVGILWVASRALPGRWREVPPRQAPAETRSDHQAAVKNAAPTYPGSGGGRPYPALPTHRSPRT